VIKDRREVTFYVIVKYRYRLEVTFNTIVE